MLHTHELADNIFARLEISKPHQQTPRENFCTEALVWCLRNEPDFRRAFAATCAKKLDVAVPSDPSPEVSSQITVRKKRGSRAIERAQFDIELLFQKKPAARIVIEAKVDSPVDAGQLQLYQSLLGRQGFLLLLVSDAKKIPIEARRIKKIFWEEIHGLAMDCTSKTASQGSSSTPEGFVLRQFANFLESLGFLPVNITLSSRAAESLAEVSTFLHSFQQILLKLKSNAELQAPHRTPVLERDEKKEITWLGLYLADPYYREGWVGLELSEKEAPSLLFEALLPKKVSPKSAREFVGKLTLCAEGTATRIQVRNPLRQGRLSTDSINSWITTTAGAIRKMARALKNSVAKVG